MADAETGDAAVIARLPEAAAAAVRGAVVVPSLARAVEELLLNAVEARATRIDVLVGEGRAGSGGSVEVRDNGCGIHPDDFANLAGLGATSKQLTPGDFAGTPASAARLNGHSGGTLAALRAVAGRLVIDSKVKLPRALGESCGSASGRDGFANNKVAAAHSQTWRKEFIKSSVVSCGISGCPRGPGTTVLAEGILDALPVRRNSAAQTSSDIAAARQCVERISLMRPRVHIQFQPLGGLARSCRLDMPPVGDVLARMGQVLGEESRVSLFAISQPRGGSACWLEGAASMPEEGQSSDRFMFLFVNGRYIDKTPLHRVVVDLYNRCADMLTGRTMTGPTSIADVAAGHIWPACVLNLRCCPSAYDFAYSPGHATVEFRDWVAVLRCTQRALWRLLRRHSACADALEGQELPRLPAARGGAALRKMGCSSLDVDQEMSQVTPAASSDSESSLFHQRRKRTASQKNSVSEDGKQMQNRERELVSSSMAPRVGPSKSMLQKRLRQTQRSALLSPHSASPEAQVQAGSLRHASKVPRIAGQRCAGEKRLRMVSRESKLPRSGHSQTTKSCTASPQTPIHNSFEKAIRTCCTASHASRKQHRSLLQRRLAVASRSHADSRRSSAIDVGISP